MKNGKNISMTTAVIAVLILNFPACGEKTVTKKPDYFASAQKLDNKLKDMVDRKNIFGLSFCISSGDGSFTWNGPAGTMDTETQYPIASITKMFTGAVIMKLRADGKINLDDRISDYLDRETIEGLHIFEGTDYSDKLTIRQLLSHTSGLPDYFTEEIGDTPCFEDLRNTQDREYSFEDIIRLTKSLKPRFAPGTMGKAYYSDANYQLLGKIIENVTGKKLEDVYREYIFMPLGLEHTYLMKKGGKTEAVSFYYNGTPQLRPGFTASEWSTGGIISTAEDMMIFIRAYFNGGIFPKEYLNEMKDWKKIQFFPMKYGTNLMRFKMPGMPAGELIGHSGSTGTVAYYVPEKDLYITGATLQLSGFKSIMITAKLLACVR